MSESIFTGGWWGLILFAVFCVLAMRWLRGGGTSGRASADGHVDGGHGGYYWMHTPTDSAGGSNGDSCGDGGGSDGGGCDGGGGDGGGGGGGD